MHHFDLDGKPARTVGTLRRVLKDATKGHGLTMDDVTVLSDGRDPYRLDTPAGHTLARWFKEQLIALGYETDRAALGLDDFRRIHLRGVHYGVAVKADVRKPNGAVYDNTDADWVFLQEEAAKCARWLGYVPFEVIVDARNAEPVIHRRRRETPTPYLNVGIEVSIPDPDDIHPTVGIEGFTGRQNFHFVLFGEKTSLEEVLAPVASRFGADLYLPAGEISDTLLYRMAQDGAADGRPMLVFTFADFDPSGNQMAVSIGRKLQALRDLYFPKLRFEVIPVGLTKEQAITFDLPQTPLRPGDSRAAAWVREHGREQTEIDALVALRPADLRRIAVEAISPFFDSTLARRVDEARRKWLDDAQAYVDDRLDGDTLERLRRQAAEKLAGLSAEIEELNRSLRVAADGLDEDLPPAEVPAATPPVDGGGGRVAPLVSADWDFATASRALLTRKRYGNGKV